MKKIVGATSPISDLTNGVKGAITKHPEIAVNVSAVERRGTLRRNVGSCIPNLRKTQLGP